MLKGINTKENTGQKVSLGFFESFYDVVQPLATSLHFINFNLYMTLCNIHKKNTLKTTNLRINQKLCIFFL